MSTSEEIDLFRTLAGAAAAADGVIPHGWRPLLDDYRKRLALSDDEVRAVAEGLRARGPQPLLPFAVRHDHFKRCAQFITSHLELTPMDRQFLEFLQKEWEIPPDVAGTFLGAYAPAPVMDAPSRVEAVPKPVREEPRAATPSRSPVLILGGTVVTALLALVAFAGIRRLLSSRSQERAPFEGHLVEYLSEVEIPDWLVEQDPGEEPPEPPAVVGRVIVMNRNVGEIDGLHFMLPEGLRAAGPGEVGTVIWLDWSESLYGGYTDGARAYTLICTVTVIDKRTWTVTGRTVIRGSDPPVTKNQPGDKSGSKPDAQVLKWITGLPRDGSP